MNICSKKSIEVKPFVKGNLYKANPNGLIFMYIGNNKGVCLNTGYANVSMIDIQYWTDVTDKYCLQEI